jgi:putative MATE family efflux protein
MVGAIVRPKLSALRNQNCGNEKCFAATRRIGDKAARATLTHPTPESDVLSGAAFLVTRRPTGFSMPRRRIDTRLLEGPIIRSLFLLAFPIMGANLLQIAYQLIDAFWVGRLGAAAVASVSVSMPVMFLMVSAGMGFAIAGTTLIAQHVGAGNRAMVDHVAAQTLLAIVSLSAVLGLIGFIGAPFLLGLMGTAPAVTANATAFLRVAFVGLPFAFLYFMFQSLMRGTGEVTVPLYIVAGTVALNFVIDPVLIFGMFGFPHLGVMGAAISTLIAQGIAAIVGLRLLMSGRYGIALSWQSFKPDFAFIRHAFNLGFPASIEQSARGLGMTVMTFLITSFGTTTTASYGVGTNVLNFIVIPAMGFSMATSTLVGQNIGAGNIDRAERVARLAALITFSALSSAGLLCYLFAPQIVATFVPEDAGVIREGTIFIRTVAWSFGFIGVQFALMGVLRASGNTFEAMLISLISQWVLQFPLAVILSEHTALHSHGLWWAFPVSNVATALIAGIWFARGDWKKRRLVAHSEEEAEEQDVAENVLI